MLRNGRLDIKRKTAGREAAQFGILRRRIKLPYIGEYPRIGRRIGARCTSNRSLIDLYNLVQRLYPLNLLKGARTALRAVQIRSQILI